jgi:hypothetical protein
MSKLNKNLIKMSLQLLGIFTFALLIIPSHAGATAYGTNARYSIGDYGNEYNPTPAIDSITPSYATVGSGAKTVTIIGSGFVPTSIARVNGTDRYTTFIDYSHLFVQLTPGDMYLGNGFYITVFNGGPGGGYSNSANFTLNKAVSYNPTPTYSNYPSQTSYNNPAPNGGGYDYNAPAPYYQNGNPNQPGNAPSDSVSTLASNAVYGSNSFLPSGIIQWLFFAIFILVIVIFVRRMFGATDKYHAAPLKHD